MTAPHRRRPLPALAFIGALCLLTALVWFRVLHRTDTGSSTEKSSCPSPSRTVVQAPTVLPVPARVTVLVLNSTQRNGIATAARKILRKDGFKIPDRAQDDTAALGGHGLVKASAQIRYGPGTVAGATLLRYYFPNAQLTPTQSSSGVVTVSLGAKYRRPATTAAVHAALAKAHITQTNKPVAPVVTPSPTPSC